jgi:hypothetical protein
MSILATSGAGRGFERIRKSLPEWKAGLVETFRAR